MNKPTIGISACLLGQKVRHNAEDKRNDWLVDVLGKFVKWVPICPEMEMGLGVPRRTMRLTGKPHDPQLIVKGTEENLTSLATKTAKTILAKDFAFDSYIFKRDSPSCGLERVKIFGKNDSPSRSAVGLFASAVKEKYPLLPMIEEGRLSDIKQRETYLVRLFASVKLKEVQLKTSALQLFHQHYKLILMAYAPDAYQKLGRLAANPERLKGPELFSKYQKDFLESLARTPTRKQWVNVLQHIFGYFKKTLDSKEKKQILETIEDYRRGELPLIVPLTLLRHLTQKYEVSYLLGQAVFEPYPKSLLVET
jgi:uncharacterized protein YbgA (DUF1722 family)/uncharacterized protein YbbK (DUF523 family)